MVTAAADILTDVSLSFDRDTQTPALPDSEEVTQRLLRWYLANRRDLPWRRTTDPYAIWISESMLQQTQVATVIPYYERWLAQFPTVRDLANADIGDVLKAWQGLGYYARARNLYRAAQVIVEKHAGEFPTDYADVLALPGVGRYTAGAICSIAFGQDIPLVDANVVRVLCRIFAIPGDPTSAPVQRRLWELAAALIPSGRARDFNQSLMELGAVVCSAAQPSCSVCPVSEICLARQLGNPTAFPEHAPRPAFTTETHVSAIIVEADFDSARVLVARRPLQGLWGGLWEFPRIVKRDSENVLEAAQRATRELAGMDTTPEPEPIYEVRHGVTTRKITLIGVWCNVIEGVTDPSGDFYVEWRWLSPQDVMDMPLSSPQARLAGKVVGSRTAMSLF